MRCRTRQQWLKFLQNAGAILQPIRLWLILRGTKGCRFACMAQRMAALATFLAAHPKVRRHRGCRHPRHELAKRQMQASAG